MGMDPGVAARSLFEAGGGQRDHTLQKCGDWSLAARRNPEAFPLNMGFPPKPRVEEVNPVQVGTAVLPTLGIERQLGCTRHAERVPARVRLGMRSQSGHKGIWRKRVVAEAGDHKYVAPMRYPKG